VKSMFMALLMAVVLASASYSRQAVAAEDVALNYGGDVGNSKYWPFAQISAKNVKDLRVVWRRPAVDASLREGFPDINPGNNWNTTPLFVDDVLYVMNAVGLVEAFDPATAKTVWVQQPTDPGLAGVSGRPTYGLAFWGNPATGQGRIVSFKGEYLYAINAKSGKLIETFGDKGRVNLHLNYPNSRPFFSHAAPIVVADVIVVSGKGGGGGDFSNNKESAPAEDVRGYDVRTGRLLWTFHLVPQPGEVGNDTWGNDSWKLESGNLGAWAPLTVDPNTGFVYIPTANPSNSWYGGDHPGQNLFADSIVCLDARTGQRVWHFQLVHHDVWDYEPAAPSTLGDIKVDGRRIKAIFQPTKSAYVFVFDRVTGKPVWPIVEQPVPQSTTPGETTWPTQPIPTKPAGIDQQGVEIDDLINFTPEIRAEALAIAQRYILGPIYTPPSVVENGKNGTLTAPGGPGAANWGGGAFDPETAMYYVPSQNQPWINDLTKPEESQKATVEWVHGPPGMVEGRGRNGDCCSRFMAMGPAGLPIVKPPYGRITAINMNTGEFAWQVPNGDGPRDNPLLKDLHLPPLGSGGRTAPLLTKTLLFAGEGSPIIVSTTKGMGGNKFRAYDKATGRVVWSTNLDAGTTSAPMSYMFHGKQYIVVTIGDADHPAELIALALP
jgi:glucose dehydrogenase